MAELESDRSFMCYWCATTSEKANVILEHSILQHDLNKPFSLRKMQLHQQSGKLLYRSVHFEAPMHKLLEKLSFDFKISIDTESVTIKFTRLLAEDTSQEKNHIYSSSSQTDCNQIYTLIDDVIVTLKSMDRLDDFISILKCIASNLLVDNIALHLLLDVGFFYAQETIHTMRYNEKTLDFWLLVQKLFKGKAINFFRGFKAENISIKGRTQPSECKINFAVPSDPVLTKHSSKFRDDASTPGILTQSLDKFAETHESQDVKLSIDGKKLALGFTDKHGDEDLCGFEHPPTLRERIQEHENDVSRLQDLQKKAETSVTNNAETIDNMRPAIMITMERMSQRVQELRELIVKKKIQLKSLFNRVDGDWKESKVAPSISFVQTKIITSQSCIDNLLNDIDRLGYVVSCLNGTSADYVLGNGVVDLNMQSNYVCLKDSELSESTETIKQHSKAWHTLRDGAKVTGSTLFKGLGLGTLREQQNHYDKVFSNKHIEVSDDLQTLFDYGSGNELNGVATLVGKILPVHFPTLHFVEDGCLVMPMTNSEYAVISGDGSLTDKAGNVKVACEIKCPMPNKERVTDVYYSLPKYYATQVLSQMASKKCSEFINLCWNPQSSTAIRGKIDEDLWGDIWTNACELYGEAHVRPTRKPTWAKDMLQKIDQYCRKSTFCIEVPSLRAIPCLCESKESTGNDHNFGKHVSAQRLDAIQDFPMYVATSFAEATKDTEAAYLVMRRQAKEVLLTVVSDLDRTYTNDFHVTHAVPIQYNLAGFSLHMDSVRGIIGQSIDACAERGLKVKVVAFDGQFLELCEETEDGRALTVLRFMKQFWNDVQHLPREEKLLSILAAATENDQSTRFLQYAGLMIKKQMTGSEELMAETEMSEDITSQETPESAPDSDIQVDMDAVLAALMLLNEEKWKTYDIDEFKELTKNAELLVQNFTVKELKCMLNFHMDRKMYNKLTKAGIVNLLSPIYGDGSTAASKPKSPKALKELTKGCIKKWTVLNINIAYAVTKFPSAFSDWERSNMFQGSITVRTHQKTFHIGKWYAQPSKMNGTILQPIIDPHHLFVNNRSRCCSKGMLQMGISSKAWWSVAQNEGTNKTGLSIELAKELRDRQSNSFAKTTFSEAVETEMLNTGFPQEARWCRLLRSWYAAVDEAGLPLEDRIQHLLDMRNFLLQYLKVGHFPPPGAYVCDMPISQFEGIVSNVDCRLQLYKLCQKGTYNNRAVSSLDSENIFGAFQDYDPKGSGVLRPADVGTAIGSALCIFANRMDLERSFHMKTSKKRRVYPEHPLMPESLTTTIDDSTASDESTIFAKSHLFDEEERRSANPKRKSGTITKFGFAAKGAQGVRSFHKSNEELIIAHRRQGINDEDLITN